MSPECVLAMRKAASLAFAVPGLEVDIRAGDDLVARVQRRFDRSTVDDTTTLLAPCTFRSAVGRLVADGTGERALFLGLEPDASLRLDYFMPFTGAARPLGMVVSRVGETLVHVFASQLGLAAATSAVAAVAAVSSERPASEWPASERPASDGVQVHCSWDDSTRISLVFCESRVCDLPVQRRHVEAMMDDVLVRVSVDEVVDTLASRTARSGGPS